MTPKQFVAKQLALPEHLRVIPDRIYMGDNRADDLQSLRKGLNPFNAADVFTADVLYENAKYFSPNGAGYYKYYPNGVF